MVSTLVNFVASITSFWFCSFAFSKAFCFATISLSNKSFVLCSVFAVFCWYLWNCGRLFLYLKSQTLKNFWNLGPDILQYFSVHLHKYFNQPRLVDFVWRCWFWGRRKWGIRWISSKSSEKKSSFSLVNDSEKKKK